MHCSMNSMRKINSQFCKNCIKKKKNLRKGSDKGCRRIMSEKRALRIPDLENYFMETVPPD